MLGTWPEKKWQVGSVSRCTALPPHTETTITICPALLEVGSLLKDRGYRDKSNWSKFP